LVDSEDITGIKWQKVHVDILSTRERRGVAFQKKEREAIMISSCRKRMMKGNLLWQNLEKI